MEITYKEKKSKEQIIEQALKYSFTCTPNDKSILIQGDNLKGLSFLLQNGYAGKIDLIYIDPPFNTQQDFFFDESRNQTISCSKNNKIAYSDRLTIDEYLEFIRERVVLLHELLSQQGSLYFHIDSKMGHYCKILIDEIFGRDNFRNDITRIKSNPKNFSRCAFGNEKDMILFYAKSAGENIWNNVTIPLTKSEKEKLFPKTDSKGNYTTIPLHAPGETQNGCTGQPWRGMLPPAGRHWRTSPEEFEKMDMQGMIEWSSTGNPRAKKYAQDHKGKKIQDVWIFKDPQNPSYPTQKNKDMLLQIINQSSNPDSLVLDCFAGGGTMLTAAEKAGRRWIGMDNSPSAIQVIKKALSEADYEEYNFL